MNEKELEKFDPTVADLTAMVEKTKGITATDLTDPTQMSVVRDSRIALKNARIRIEKTGKGLREDAVKFQRAVIEKEKELIAIISPEEDRLSAIEEEAKLLALRKARKENIPALIARMIEAGVTEFHEAKHLTEEQMLDMDANAFEAYFNTLVAEKNEADRLAAEKKQQEEEEQRKEAQRVEDEKRAEAQRLEDEKRAEENRILEEKKAELAKEEQKIADEKKRIAHEAEIKAAEEKAKIETEERLKKEADDKTRRETEEADRIERQRKEDQAALEKREAYKKFLADNGVTEATKSEFKIENTDEGYTIYKKVAFMKK